MYHNNKTVQHRADDLFSNLCQASQCRDKRCQKENFGLYIFYIFLSICQNSGNNLADNTEAANTQPLKGHGDLSHFMLLCKQYVSLLWVFCLKNCKKYILLLLLLIKQTKPPQFILHPEYFVTAWLWLGFWSPCATLRLRVSIYSSIILHEAKLQCTICFLTESCM